MTRTKHVSRFLLPAVVACSRIACGGDDRGIASQPSPSVPVDGATSDGGRTVVPNADPAQETAAPTVFVVTLSVPKSQVADGDLPLIGFTIMNKTNQEQRIASRLTPLRELENDLFTVTRDGVPVDYHGVYVEYIDRVQDEPVILAPGKSRYIEFNLAEYYDVGEPGTYHIEPRLSPHAGIESSGTEFQLLHSRPTTLSPQSRRDLEKREKYSSRVTKVVNQEGAYEVVSPELWTSSGLSDIFDDVESATALALDGLADLTDVARPIAHRRYALAFGQYHDARYEVIVARIRALLSFSGITLSVETSCDDDWVAYVNSRNRDEIHLCPPYFVTPSSLFRGRALLHEMAHSRFAANDDCYAWSVSGKTGLMCHVLAARNPAAMPSVADAYAEFLHPSLTSQTPADDDMHQDLAPATAGYWLDTISRFCMDVDGDPGTQDGSTVHLWDCERFGRGPGGGQTDQAWTIDASGYIRNNLSGKCLDVDGPTSRNVGAKVQLWTCDSNNNTTDQRWWLDSLRRLHNIQSGLCLGYSGFEPGTDLIVTHCNDTNHVAQWQVLPRQYSRFQNRANDESKCLDIAGAPGNSPGDPAQLWTCEPRFGAPGGRSDQWWGFSNSGYIYKAADFTPGSNVTILGLIESFHGNGTKLGVVAPTPGTSFDADVALTWTYTKGGNLRSERYGLCLDLNGDPATNNGDAAQLWDCERSGITWTNNQTDQRWTFTAED